MNKKNMGLLITVAAIIFCGLPGLLMGVLSGVWLMESQSPETTPSLLSLAPLGASVLLMLIPVGVGFIAFHKKHGEHENERVDPLAE